MTVPAVGHVLSDPAQGALWIVVAFVLAFVLAAQHLRVKHGSFGRAPLRSVAIVGALAVAASAVIAPTVGAGQARNGLPDLISDPPRPAFLKELRGDDGERRLVLTFDGYVHNIGTGPLEVVGNPQEPDGMVQRVRESGEWREVGTPTVRYETDDGHNHFHLIEAIDYVLWNESQGTQTAAGSKIGFCLVDSEQMEPGTDQAYSEELDNFCEEDNPSATSLRMGISSGWRDIYDATTTLQWVDVSEIAPGRYWIGAITDPNDEIVESNEDNNDLIFSEKSAVVPGWLPWDAEAETEGEAVDIELVTQAFGTVTEASYVIEQGPANGHLSVPVGASFSSPLVRYTPDQGFTGTDTFEFSVRDTSSLFPTESPTATIAVNVTGTLEVSGSLDGAEASSDGAAPTLTLETTLFEMEAGEPFELTATALDADGQPASLSATGLPLGLSVDGQRVTGVAALPGFYDVEFIAYDSDGTATSQAATFVVDAASTTGLASGVDRSTPLLDRVQVTVGSPSLGAMFEASGLPDGLTIDEFAPVVSGSPVAIGAFDVELRQTNPDGTERTAAFTWVVRPAATINFAL